MGLASVQVARVSSIGLQVLFRPCCRCSIGLARAPDRGVKQGRVGVKKGEVGVKQGRSYIGLARAPVTVGSKRRGGSSLALLWSNGLALVWSNGLALVWSNGLLAARPFVVSRLVKSRVQLVRLTTCRVGDGVRRRLLWTTFCPLVDHLSTTF